MLQILNTQVSFLRESVIASGNAMRTTPVTDYSNEEEFQKGLTRMMRMVNHSEKDEAKCHDNALTGIRVCFDIVYPQYWSMEAQRYHFLDIVMSASKMHRLAKMNIREACNKYVDMESVRNLQQHIVLYNIIVNDPEIKYRMFDIYDHGTKQYKVVQSKTHEECVYYARMKMLSNCPMGLELFEQCNTNYKQLQTIWHQRHDHRLQEDWGAFCKWIESLPYADQLIFGREPAKTNSLLYKATSDDKCCGACAYMDYEMIDGDGFCSKHNTQCNCALCCDNFAEEI